MSKVTAELKEIIAIAAEGARLAEEARDALRESIAQGIYKEAEAAEAKAKKRGSTWSDRGIDLRRVAARVRAGEWG